MIYLFNLIYFNYLIYFNLFKSFKERHGRNLSYCALHRPKLLILCYNTSSWTFDQQWVRLQSSAWNFNSFVQYWFTIQTGCCWIFTPWCSGVTRKFEHRLILRYCQNPRLLGTSCIWKSTYTLYFHNMTSKKEDTNSIQAGISRVVLQFLVRFQLNFLIYCDISKLLYYSVAVSF